MGLVQIQSAGFSETRTPGIPSPFTSSTKSSLFLSSHQLIWLNYAWTSCVFPAKLVDSKSYTVTRRTKGSNSIPTAYLDPGLDDVPLAPDHNWWRYKISCDRGCGAVSPAPGGGFFSRDETAWAPSKRAAPRSRSTLRVQDYGRKSGASISSFTVMWMGLPRNHPELEAATGEAARASESS